MLVCFAGWLGFIDPSNTACTTRPSNKVCCGWPLRAWWSSVRIVCQKQDIFWPVQPPKSSVCLNNGLLPGGRSGACGSRLAFPLIFFLSPWAGPTGFCVHSQRSPAIELFPLFLCYFSLWRFHPVWFICLISACITYVLFLILVSFVWIKIGLLMKFIGGLNTVI